MVVHKVVGITAKRNKNVRWELSETMADKVKDVFERNGMQVEVFKHKVPLKREEFIEWLNKHAV